MPTRSVVGGRPTWFHTLDFAVLLWETPASVMRVNARLKPTLPRHRRCIGEGQGERARSLIVLLIILLLLFGGGGFYLGGPVVGGSLGTIILVILIVMLVSGKRL